jgi:hypothetical protein
LTAEESSNEFLPSAPSSTSAALLECCDRLQPRRRICSISLTATP